MEIQRWRDQLRLVVTCVAVAATISYGMHLWFDNRRRGALKQIMDMHQRLKRELDDLRGEVDQIGGTPDQRLSRSIRIDSTGPGSMGSAVVRSLGGPGKSQHDLKSDDEEFYEFSEV